MLVVAGRVGVLDQIRYFGLAKNSDMTGFFGGATALVMPSFFGPTNVPIIEAWAVGCPVITANVRGIRQMCGDAALLVDAGSIDSIADAIARVWNDAALATTLAECGRLRFAVFSPGAFRQALCDALARLGATH